MSISPSILLIFKKCILHKMSCKWKISKLNKSKKQEVNYRSTFLLYSKAPTKIWNICFENSFGGCFCVFFATFSCLVRRFMYKCSVIYFVVCLQSVISFLKTKQASMYKINIQISILQKYFVKNLFHLDLILISYCHRYATEVSGFKTVRFPTGCENDSRVNSRKQQIAKKKRRKKYLIGQIISFMSRFTHIPPDYNLWNNN